ncbi:proline--tRNA ligase [Mesoaciditoga lauensis]|uniref:proline--tRNA ligase n=1 Tax=Mesoaciditoga lauensis TaxID=1495039 RepID=UPI000566254E|nr:proline--tRNA ligase [Mesoaciditoga lauensis]
MKWSNLYAPTLKEVPSDADIKSQELLVRAGFIRKAVAGVYSYLPLGLRVLQKITQIVREEMNNIGAQELLMPIMQPAEIWKTTGRWEDYGPEMVKFKDRNKREFTLGPTHEEMITTLVKGELKSYKQLPVTLYQINTKYRDEIRPRFGLLRGREFIMKDAYSFHTDEKSLDETYQNMYKAYSKICKRMDLEYFAVEADTGAIGGNNSHEFTILAKNGESNILYCDECGYAATDEKAEYMPDYPSSNESEKELELVETPNVKTVEELSKFLGIDKTKIVKTMVFVGRNGVFMTLIRGDLEINEAKLKAHFKDQTIRKAFPEEVVSALGVPIGYLGPVGSKVKIFADFSVKSMKNFVVGGMKEEYHYVNANVDRDFKVSEWIDMKRVVAGDRCPKCGAPLKMKKGIEVGQIFKLGTKYSEKLEAFYVDANGERKPFVMGCYGWGVSRTIAAVVEQYHDENGMIWPRSIAPFEIVVTVVNSSNADQMKVGNDIYEFLKDQGFDVLLDDREVSGGFKFKDADLIGIPLRITVGRKLKDGKVEMKLRNSKDVYNVNVEKSEIFEKAKEMLNDYKLK